MSFEPRARQSRHLLERIGLFKQMRGSGDNDELLFAAQLRERRLIQLDDREVVSSHDQQGGGLDARQSLPRQVRASAARDDRNRQLGALGRRDQRSGGAGAGAEIADRQLPGLRMLKRKCPVRMSTASLSGVSRSTSRVGSPASLSTRAT
jgi:hypothetical protein